MNSEGAEALAQDDGRVENASPYDMDAAGQDEEAPDVPVTASPNEDVAAEKPPLPIGFPAVITHRGVVVAREAAVAASQPLAVSAALDILAQGGTFADAAIAASAVLCVVEPWNSHLGGDAFLIVHDAARRQNHAFNGSGAAPARVQRESFVEEGGIPVRGMRSATVPGLVSAWFALHERYGSRPFSQLLERAIYYAQNGFPAGPRLCRTFAAHAALFEERPGLPAAFGVGADVKLGQVIRQPDLARTFRALLTYGRNAFYSGSIAKHIVRHAIRHGGSHFSFDDLARHRTRILSPLAVRYRDYLVYGQPPPSQGLILMEELALAEGIDLAALDPAARAHWMVEAKKLAFADRNAYLADPEVVGVPVETLLSPEYIERRREQIDPERAAQNVSAGDLAPVGTDTTYFLVADGRGNAVSFIQSVFHAFGSGEMIEGTGVLLNNRLTGFSLDPASPNVLAPGKRPAHTLNAWLATRADDGKLAFVGGTPGGHTQVQTNFQLLVNLIDGGMDPQQAIEAPRWQHMTEGGAVSSESAGAGVLEIEERVGEAVIADLQARGHEVRPIGPWAHGSSVQLLAVLPDSGTYALGSDPRCDGQAAGF